MAMTKSLSPRQALLLWCLLARGGEELQSRIRPEVKKADRETLAGLGLLTSAKTPGRGLRLAVTDGGWRWAQDHMDHPLPPACLALQDLIKRLGVYLQKADTTLAEFVTSSEVAPSPEDVRAAIERAYFKIGKAQKSRYVSLTKIRAELDGFERQAVDAALLQILKEHGKATLAQEASRRKLSESDRAAAFSSGGEEFHFLRIES
jgi:hypothetical protein